MGFKDEFKREMRNVMKDIEKEVHRTWTVHYKGHTIEVINEMKEEHLNIDGITVDTNKRKSMLTHIKPYSKLIGTLVSEDGTKHKVSVKLGGYIKFNCTIRVDNETILDDSQKLEFLPWDHKEKIVPLIQRQVQEHNKVVDDLLPDDEYLFDENHPRLAAGLSDHFVDDTATIFFVKKLVKLFEEQVNHPTTKTRKATYEKVISDNIVSYSNEFIERFHQVGLDETIVQQEALWLLDHAAHREVVKFAIVVLGCTNCEKYKELLFAIGLHEEFTPYVIFALNNGTVQANNQIWRLAQKLNGWGKITAVEQLEATTPEIKQWLLTEGCENNITNEYLAYPCAMKGELDVALYEETISKELYDGANLIIQGLLSEIAPQGIEDYPYASAVLSRFVYHARFHCHTLEDFYPLIKISEFINADKEVWEERFNNQWKPHECDSIQQALQPVILDSKWSQLAKDALQKEFDYKAFEIARYYEIDVTSHLFDLLEKYPTNNGLYLAIMATKVREYIEDLCNFAETNFPLSNLSNEEQECVQCIVQDLQEHEGVGLPLLQAALESDNVSLHYHALSVLKEWSQGFCEQPTIQTAIKKIATSTKDKEIRQLAKEFM